MNGFQSFRISCFVVVECVNNELLHPYPVLAEKKGEFVAQFKYTVAVRKEGPLIICGNTIDLSKYSSEHKITEENVVKALAVPLDNFLPNSKKVTKKEKKKEDDRKNELENIICKMLIIKRV